MTRAQTVFVIALSVVSLAIVGFAVFVVSSTMWSGRWYPRKKRQPAE